MPRAEALRNRRRHFRRRHRRQVCWAGVVGANHWGTLGGGVAVEVKPVGPQGS